MYINLTFYSQQILLSSFITLVSFLSLPTQKWSFLLTWALKKDHTMFRQGRLWGSVFLAKVGNVEFSGSVETEWTNTGPPIWPSIAGGTTTKTITQQRLRWEILGSAPRGSSSSLAPSEPWVIAPEASTAMPGAPMWEPSLPRPEGRQSTSHLRN